MFKVLYPVIGALFPVAVYSLACRVLASHWAFMAAVFVVMQSTFFQSSRLWRGRRLRRCCSPR